MRVLADDQPPETTLPKPPWPIWGVPGVPPKPPPKVARKIPHFIGDLAIFRGILGGVFGGLIWGCFGGVPRMVAG